MQLLSDASGGRLVVHHDDALEFDLARHCCNSVDTKPWDSGRFIVLLVEFIGTVTSGTAVAIRVYC